MFKKFVLLALISSVFLPFGVKAQTDNAIFKAEVVEVVKEVRKVDDKGQKTTQQILTLRGLENEWKNKEITFDSVALNIEIVGQKAYKVGDKVLVTPNLDETGKETFFITDYVRTGKLYFIIFFFFLVILAVARKQGLKAIIGLLATFIVLMKFIIPRILAGSDPIFISIVGSLVILTITIYLVHGLNAKSSTAVLGTLFSLIVTGILAIIFTNLTRLTGFAQEESVFLINLGERTLNIKGLLLAGMIIGALGVLDDIAVSQASIAEQIQKANPELPTGEIYKHAMRVGVDHVSSIVNTLVLAYAGASLPIMILFVVNNGDGLTFSQAINNEAIATEIVRTVAGSVGLILAVPITTFIAIKFFKRKGLPPTAEPKIHGNEHLA